LFPELSIPGYPAGDLLCQDEFIRANLAALKALARSTRRPAAVVGYAEPNPSAGGKPLFNAAALLDKGRIAARRFKTLLPTYDVFDEGRYFQPAPSNEPVAFRGRRLGLTLCEDLWNDPDFWPRPLYGKDPVRSLSQAGADLLLNLSASPYDRGKGGVRLKMLESRARKARAPLLYCNLVGGNDEVVFDGNSLAFDARGRLRARGKAFGEDLVVVDPDSPGPAAPRPGGGDISEVHGALVLGLRDYARKCGFREALVGLSGGIDSAVVCALAADALGPKAVLGVSMPSPWSSRGSVEDARALASNLGVRLLALPIAGVYEAALKTLSEVLPPGPMGLSEQNLQARIRGLLLMAVSNKRGALLLSTGNKSELSMGYCTLYGDMAGGLALIADVPKTTVYELAAFINRGLEIIPRATIEKPPSAELKPGQKDQDDLPPYDALDSIMRAYVERGLGARAISALGHPRRLVDGILDRIDRSEYKRRQAPPGIKITSKAFGIGRRMPIARGSYRAPGCPQALSPVSAKRRRRT
jgi:NAD+ synthetase